MNASPREPRLYDNSNEKGQIGCKPVFNHNSDLTLAASRLMTLPVIMLFVLAQRYFSQGTTLTGMKG